MNGLQPLMLMIQRGLRRLGLHRVADWFESKSESETLDLLRRARAAITMGARTAAEQGTTSEAVFAYKDHVADQSQLNSPTVDDKAQSATRGIASSYGRTSESEKKRYSQPDPFGLRMFGLRSLNMVNPAYRDTENWRTIPAAMSSSVAVAEIRSNLARIEETYGGMFCLDVNGNIGIVQWNSRTDHHSVLRAITELADTHGLGVLTKRSAFKLDLENDAILRAHGFSIWGATVTGAATGRNGPPNGVTFVRKPTGAPLFTHRSSDASFSTPGISQHAGYKAMADSSAMTSVPRVLGETHKHGPLRLNLPHRY
jgi:hypothetical protein